MHRSSRHLLKQLVEQVGDHSVTSVRSNLYPCSKVSRHASSICVREDAREASLAEENNQKTVELSTAAEA